MIRLAVFLIVLTLVSACASGARTTYKKDQASVLTVSQVAKQRSPKPPPWIIGRNHHSFPTSNYLTGVGVSQKNPVSANESARSELAKSLKVKIRSVMHDISTQESSKLHLIIETQVDTFLEGVSIKDGWYDPAKKVYYSFAVLDRQLASDAVRDRIENIKTHLLELMRKGEEHEATGDVMSALSHYFSGYREATLLLSLKNAWRVITRSPEVPTVDPLSTDDFASRASEVVHNLSLSLVSGDGQIVNSISGLRQSLIVEVNFKGKPIQGIPVAFQFEQGAGELETKKVSDTDGRAETTVHNIFALQEKNHRVSAKFDYDRIVSRFQTKPAEKFLSPLRGINVIFNYSIKTPEWGTEKSLAWKKGITGMVNQIIRNIPPGGNPTVGIAGFKDLRLDRIVPFSRILREDFKTILVQAENLTVKEVPSPAENQLPRDLAKSAGLDFYISGSYRMENRGLEIRGQLTETATGHILSSARAQIARSEIYPNDLTELASPTLLEKLSLSAGDYDTNLEKLIFARPSSSSFNIKVWVDKTDYEIGDTITFNIKSDKDCYLTLLDIGSSRNITVIFPNKYRSDNFVRAGTVYQIPGPGYGFRFDVQGPPGLERIKAVATLTPGTPIKLDLQKGFHSIERGTTRGSRDIKVMADRFSTNKSSPWTQAYTEIFIYKKEKTYFRGSRQVPLILKPKKPIDMIGTFGKEQKLPVDSE